MANLKELLVRIRGDSTAFQADMAKLNSQLGVLDRRFSQTTRGFASFGQAVTSAGMSITATMTLPIVGLGAAAVAAAGQMEQAKTAFTTMLGSGQKATAMLNELQAFALRTPFEFRDLQDAARRMLALGFSAKQVIPTLTSIGNAVSAMGGGKEMIDRVTLALGQMRAKGGVQAEEMRQLAEAGIPAWQDLAAAIGVSIPEAMKLVEKRAVSSAVAIPAILLAMNRRFAGGMEEQSKTLLGQWSNVKDRMFKTMSDIGSGMLPLAKRVVEGGITPALLAASDLAAAFAKLPPGAQNVGIGLAAIAAAVGPVTLGLGLMATSIVSIKRALELIGPAMALTGRAMIAVPWIATAVAVGALALAYKQLRDATKQVEEAQQSERDSLSLLEIKIKQRGIDISKLQTQYGHGEIGMRKYRDELLALGGVLVGTKGATKPVLDSVEALQDALLAGTITWKEYTEALKRFDAVAEKSRKMSLSELVSAEGLKRGQAAIEGTVKAIFEWVNAGTVLSSGLELQKSEVAGLATATTLYRAELQRLAGVKIEQSPVDTGKMLAGSMIENERLMREAGMTAQSELRRRADQAAALWEEERRRLGENKATAQDVQRAYENWTKAEMEAAGTSKQVAAERKKGLQEISTIVNDLSRDLSRSLIHWKGFGEMGKRAMESIGEAITRNVIQKLLESTKLVDSLSGLLGKVLGWIPGLGGAFGVASKTGTAAASGALSIPGITSAKFPGWLGGGSKSAGAATSSLGSALSVVGAVGSIGSMVSGIIGNFQSAKLETTMNATEWNTRKSSLHLESLLSAANNWWPWMKNATEAIYNVAGGFSPNLGLAAAGDVHMHIEGGYFTSDRALDELVDAIARRMKARGL